MSSSTTSKHPAHALLSKAHPPSTADTIFTDKVLHKPLHLRPTSPDPTSQDARAQRRLKRLRKSEHKLRHQKPKPLSAKEKRVSGIYDIPKEHQKYSIYVPLHEMWTKYMWEILGLKEGHKSFVTPKNAGPMLTSADYHGSKLRVVRSKCTSTVGLEGIVVRDTKFTFQIITAKNELKSMCFVPQMENGSGALTSDSYTEETYRISVRDTTAFEFRGVCSGTGGFGRSRPAYIP